MKPLLLESKVSYNSFVYWFLIGQVEEEKLVLPYPWSEKIINLATSLSGVPDFTQLYKMSRGVHFRGKGGGL